tara:strand:- start:258 stop:1373 length:1116 start_codon:yes stop_codon:yes gene_type:complete
VRVLSVHVVVMPPFRVGDLVQVRVGEIWHFARVVVQTQGPIPGGWSAHGNVTGYVVNYYDNALNIHNNIQPVTEDVKAVPDPIPTIVKWLDDKHQLGKAPNPDIGVMLDPLSDPALNWREDVMKLVFWGEEAYPEVDDVGDKDYACCLWQSLHLALPQWLMNAHELSMFIALRDKAHEAEVWLAPTWPTHRRALESGEIDEDDEEEDQDMAFTQEGGSMNEAEERAKAAAAFIFKDTLAEWASESAKWFIHHFTARDRAWTNMHLTEDAQTRLRALNLPAYKAYRRFVGAERRSPETAEAGLLADASAQARARGNAVLPSKKTRQIRMRRKHNAKYRQPCGTCGGAGHAGGTVDRSVAMITHEVSYLSIVS